MTSKQKYGILLIGTVMIMGIAVVKFRDVFDAPDTRFVYSEEVNRYMALEFIPKYKAADCAIHFNLHTQKTGKQFDVPLEYAFQRYISYNDHTVGMVIVRRLFFSDVSEHPKTDGIVLYEAVLADQCWRRDEIFQEMVSYALDQIKDEFTIERVPIDGPVVALGNMWIDRPDYDPKYWTALHKAMRGDGEAYMALADLAKPDDFHTKHLMSALAEHFLPEGPLKESARQGKEAAFIDLFPEQQARTDDVVQHWIEGVQRYNGK